MNDYGRRVGEAAAQLLRDGDVLVNEVASVNLADTAPNQTVSKHVAMLNRDGSRFGCIFCRFLDITVQRGHCEAMFTDAPSPWWVYPRAGLMFAVVLGGGSWLIAEALTHLARGLL